MSNPIRLSLPWLPFECTLTKLKKWEGEEMIERLVGLLLDDVCGESCGPDDHRINLNPLTAGVAYIRVFIFY